MPDYLYNLKKAPKGNAYYGGIFRLNEVEGFRTLFPPSVTDVTSHRMIQPVYEGLVRFSQHDLSVQPCLAYRWTVDSSGTVYVFYLRKGVYFHEDACFGKKKTRQLTAYDVKYCFDKLCEPATLNKNYGYFEKRILGAEQYYRSVKQGRPFRYGVSGVQVLSKYVLRIILTKPYGSFIKILGTAPAKIYPREALEKYGANMQMHCVGTGPFILKSATATGVEMVRNKNYWGHDSLGNHLPYLDGLKISFVNNRKSELLEFDKDNLDMVYGIPVEFRKYMLDSQEHLKPETGNYQLQVTPVMTAQYYGFLLTSPEFSDVRVRQAFNYAVDREAIVKNALHGEGYAGVYGMVPPAFGKYAARSVNGYDYDPDTARKLMAAAGFPEGKGFPMLTLHISSGGSIHENVAKSVQSMLEANLGIHVSIESLPWAQHLEKVEKGEFSFFRYGWQADYPDPESFLNLCYGVNLPSDPAMPSFQNPFRYRCDSFDRLYARALFTPGNANRLNLLAQADQQVIKDAVMMVLFYPKDYRLLQPYVRNFDANPMEVRDFSIVYFDKAAISAKP